MEHYLLHLNTRKQASKISLIVTLNPIITISLMTILTVINVDWIEGEIMNLKSAMGASLVLIGAILALGVLEKMRKS